jgi:hypothetical protein
VRASALTLVRADFLVTAVTPLREDDRPFARPRAGKDRYLKTAVIISPLDVPVAGSLAILEQECWVRTGYAHILLTQIGQQGIETQSGPGGDADPAPIGHLRDYWLDSRGGALA